MDIRLTAQLVLSGREAILAYSRERNARGECGETHEALLIGTTDRGETWDVIPLHRTFLDGMVRWGYPTWPSEAIMELSKEEATIQMIFRDEWVPFETGGESLWRATQHRNGKWSTSRIRYMDYDGDDSPIPIDAIELALPTSIKSPDDRVFVWQNH